MKLKHVTHANLIGSCRSSEHAWVSIYHNWCVRWWMFICQ